MKKIIVTGSQGFVASHLIEFLLKKNEFEIYGIDKINAHKENTAHIKDKFKFIEADLTDHVSVYSVLKEIKPDIIFNLAAIAFVPYSWKSPQDTLINNIISQLNILESLRELKINPIMHVSCSSEEYGLVLPHEVPINENNQLRPLSTYAVSKVTQEKLCLQYVHSYGLNIIVTRGFNHTGPRRGEDYVCSNFAKQIAIIEKGEVPPVIYVGNLDAQRDFTDVRDMVKAYWLAVEHSNQTIGRVFNIGSGKAYSIKEVLNILLSYSKIKIEVKQDEARMRPSDVPLLLCDSSRFRSITGWENTIPFENTLLDLLNFWRDKLR